MTSKAALFALLAMWGVGVAACFPSYAEEAMADFMIDFSGVLKKSGDILRFSGEGTIIFDYQYGYWYVKNVDLPMDIL